MALSLTRRWQAQLILARVVDPSLGAVGLGPMGLGSMGTGLAVPGVAAALLERENAEVDAYLQRQRERCQDLGAQTLKRVGPPWDSVAQIARDERCDLVVMAPSPRERRLVDPQSLGSVSTWSISLAESRANTAGAG